MLNEESFLSASDDCKILLWKYEQSETEKIFSHHTEFVNSLLQISPDQIASGSSDMTIVLFDLLGTRQAQLIGHSNSVFSITVMAKNQIISSSAD